MVWRGLEPGVHDWAERLPISGYFSITWATKRGILPGEEV
jgi:hypothetical protein